MMLSTLLPLALVSTVLAKTVNYDFNVTWTTGNPDGKFERKVMGINGVWPIPTLSVDEGDRVIINMTNGLGDVMTSLHFHGLFMNGTSYMDGPAGITQCGVAPGNHIVYNFTVEQPGTYWYHSHVRGQYTDGLRAPFIVHPKTDPYGGKYEKELILSLSDWYHDEVKVLTAEFLSVSNPTGAEPVPKSAIQNDSPSAQFTVEAGKTYMVRIVNMGAFAGQYLWFEGLTFQVVEVDGVFTEEGEATMIYVTAAQRYSVLVTIPADATGVIPFVGSMDEDLFDTVPDGLNPNCTGYLIIGNSTASLPDAAFVDTFDYFDDFTLVPIDKEPIFEDPAYSFQLTVLMDNLGDGANYAFFNGISFAAPKVPTLYTALNAGNLSNNTTIYGRDTNPHVFKHNDVIELIVNNNDAGKHPFHLHGHNFQLVYRSDEDAGFYNDSVPMDMPAQPMRRDTVLIRPGGNMVLRFRADNPGVWLFHCHIEWHVESGLIATFIEAPEQMQKTLSVPQDHLDLCTKQNLPIIGNAAANAEDYLDLTGQNLSVAPLPAGFTARGIVALVFSVISAFLGMAVISFYGTQEIRKKPVGRTL